MRVAVALFVVVVALTGCGSASAGDCGLSGVAAHPEIGGELVYTCGLPSENGTKLYLLDVATGHVRAFVDDHAWNTDPAWSPDGKRLAWVSTRDGRDDIYVMDVASGAVTRITDGGGWNGNPTWSPDGTKLMFDSSRDGVTPSRHNSFRNIFVARADGTAITRVTGLAGYNGVPSWSPDGTRVAFSSDRDGIWGMYVMKADGTAQTLIRPGGTTYARWSADGTKILFQGSARGDSADDATIAVYMMAADGTGERQITTADDSKPDSSFDGRWIATARMVGRTRELFIVSADGATTVQLTGDGTYKDWPRWRP